MRWRQRVKQQSGCVILRAWAAVPALRLTQRNGPPSRRRIAWQRQAAAGRHLAATATRRLGAESNPCPCGQTYAWHSALTLKRFCSLQPPISGAPRSLQSSYPPRASPPFPIISSLHVCLCPYVCMSAAPPRPESPALPPRTAPLHLSGLLTP